MKDKGFTLIELIVVIAIIGILSTVFLADYRGGDKEFSLKRSAHKLAQDIRSVQENSVSSKEFQGEFQGGFGVYLTEGANQYILFIDCNGDGIYNGSFLYCSDCTGGSCIENRYSERIETILFEEGTSISTISSSLGGDFSVVFTPPDPVITFTPDDTEVLINLQAQVSGSVKTKTIELNKAGLISVLQ